MDALQKCLLAILEKHQGFENRIGRERLRAACSAELDSWVKDREMRKAIQALRQNHPRGAMIGSTSGSEPMLNVDAATAPAGGGYWLARNREELDMHLHEDERRAKVILVRLAKQRVAAGMELDNVHMVALQGMDGLQ